MSGLCIENQGNLRCLSPSNAFSWCRRASCCRCKSFHESRGGLHFCKFRCGRRQRLTPGNECLLRSSIAVLQKVSMAH